jgi:hypothetical protein
MKQNPSCRQASTSYLDTLRSELDALTQQLQESETAASTAQQEADVRRRALSRTGTVLDLDTLVGHRAAPVPREEPSRSRRPTTAAGSGAAA